MVPGPMKIYAWIQYGFRHGRRFHEEYVLVQLVSLLVCVSQHSLVPPVFHTIQIGELLQIKQSRIRVTQQASAIDKRR